MFADHGPEHFAQVPVHSFHLTVALGVISGSVSEADIQDPGEFLEEPLGELLAAVGVDGVRHSEAGEYISNQGLRSRVSRRVFKRKCFDPLGEAVPTGE